MERETESERASPGDGEITDCSYSTSEQPGLLSRLGAREQEAGATFFFELPASLSGKRLPPRRAEAPKRAKTRRGVARVFGLTVPTPSLYLLSDTGRLFASGSYGFRRRAREYRMQCFR